jgi:hypothetical protein
MQWVGECALTAYHQRVAFASANLKHSGDANSLFFQAIKIVLIFFFSTGLSCLPFVAIVFNFSFFWFVFFTA